MPDSVALTVALALLLSGGSVLAVAAVAVTALRQRGVTGPVTADHGGQVHITQAGRDASAARLPDTQIAALEDALSYLAQARDGLAAGALDDADLALRLAAFILSLQRAGRYKPTMTVADLTTLFRSRVDGAERITS